MPMLRPELEWVQNIPENWHIMPLKRYFEFGKGLPITKADLIESGEKVISYGQIHAKYNTGVNIDSRLIRYVPSSFLETNLSSLCTKGDVIIADTSEDIDGCGNAVYVDTDEPVFAGYHTIILKSDKNNKYLAYLFLSDAWRTQIKKQVHGIKVFSITQTILRQCNIILPPDDEQQAIADFLDNRCSKIDEIIAEATASIEEYKELKQAVITDAVTKGLRNRPLMYSGDPNIGDIANNWRVCKTLYGLAMPITDGPHTTPELYSEGVPFISAEAVSCGQGSIDFDHMRGYISEEFYQECCKKYIPAIDDIYMIKSGATTGRVSMVDMDRKFTIWSPLAVFRIDKTRMYARYLYYFLQSRPYQQQVQLGWTFGTQQNIGMRTLEKLKICMPPLDEQVEIAEYLDGRIGDMDALISEKQALIEDLQAYKKSLIYEVVTGKRRVV